MPPRKVKKVKTHSKKAISDFSDSIQNNFDGSSRQQTVSTDSQQPDSPKEIDILLSMVKARVTLLDLTQDMWENADKDLLTMFLEDPSVRVLILFVDPHCGIVIEHCIRTAFSAKQVSYFIKNPKTREVTSENFLNVIQYGLVKGPYLESLLRTLSGVYAPLFFENNTWPDSIKNDFFAQMHKFLAILTDTHWKLEEKTVLYIPKENLDIPISIAAKHKAFVQRLETSMIHWARQIKEVLSNQHAIESSETSGPLDEIEFWRNRCADLSGISTQLDHKIVRRITQILDTAKSSYVAPFLRLSSQIKEGSQQAESNLRFLMILKEPCKKLSEALPKDIPPIISNILNLIRIIWMNSEFYNTKDKLTGLLKKLSNEIIHQCVKSINLDRIFAGYIRSSSQILTDCIECCEKWREKYEATASLHNRCAPVGWVLDLTNIFAQVDAFVQRCRDLLEVCDTQVHFARMEEGYQTEMPYFGGQRGPDISRGLLEIEHSHLKYMNQLRQNQKSILDIKSTAWHDDFNRFRASIKDLEVMLQTLIMSSFETVTSVSEGIDLIDIFTSLCNRENIRRAVDKKTRSTFNLFIEEMNTVKKELTMKAPAIQRIHPKYSGAACWLKNLKSRIDSNMKMIERAYFISSSNFGDINKNYNQLIAALDDNVRKYFNEWNLSLDKDPLTYLDAPLMYKSDVDNVSVLHVNFNKNLIKMLNEIHYWEYLMFEIPYYAARLYSKQKDLRERRENILLVVRDYNRIITSLNANEVGLFKERIKFLDKKISPGLTKLTWNSKGTTDIFINDCRNSAERIQQRVDMFRAENVRIARNCVLISELLLAEIDSRKIYEELELKTHQTQHRTRMLAKVIVIHEEIMNTIDKLFEIFKNDGPDVYNYWFVHVSNLDMMVEEACRLNIKASLQVIARAVYSDNKTAPNPLFNVDVILKDDRIQFSPSVEDLDSMVAEIGTEMVASLDQLPRLIQKYPKPGCNKLPYSEEILANDEISKVRAQINAGMKSIATKLSNYRLTWEEEKVLWEIDKESFIEKYKQSHPSVSKFDGDIGRYTEKANSIQSKETVMNIDFVVLNCTPLKAAIQAHCYEWQNKLTSLLLELATTELHTLDSYITENTEKMMKAPTSLEDLKTSLKLWDLLYDEQISIEARFEPLMDQFSILNKYEVTIAEESTTMLQELQDRWNGFKATIETSDIMLKKSKDQFKSALMTQSEGFKKQVAHLLDDFQQKGPFSSEIPCDVALEGLAGFRESVATLKAEEQVLRGGLNMFKVDLPPSKEILLLEKELELIETIWQISKEWEANWSVWKVSRFTDIQTEEIETISLTVSKKLNKLSRDLKDRHWSILEASKFKVDTFKRTMPLIQDLKNPAMRPRHWEQISSEIQRQFDYTSDEFTLERIIDLGFDQYAEFINGVSSAAKKELFIEQNLEVIKSTWEMTEMDMVQFKTLYKIKGTDDVFASLDENQIQLSTMKASRFVKPFEQEVDYWERTLSHILEVMELLMNVQRQWMYLENIFLGEDIRKQLPVESEDFDGINSNWKVIMTRAFKDKNALRATHCKGLYDQLNGMNQKLEAIQKSLDMYLETKRQIFPRFYFLSNDDLLEILGQGRNPEAVQPHLKKCFDNIKSLTINKPSSQKFEAIAMNSCEGEGVEFKPQGTLIEGPVESWLTDIEKTMRYTLKEILITTRNALKKQLNKRDKWIKEYCGQMTIVASQIQWTGDMTKALMKVKERGDKKALKMFKKKQVVMLNKYAELARKPDKGYQRIKLVSLITIEVHNRDIIEKLIKSGCNDVGAFEWISQLRLYWDKELNDCIVRQTNTQFLYGYEYLGNSGRLVITPLTDRCYMTLTTALHLHRGGSPKGPAGTGKTETTKDLGKSLGSYVIVVNCSEGLDYKSMGRMFAGLAQTGAWGCFDEFNRINIEVLSVVAQQILSILTALHAGVMSFLFEGRFIDLIWSCGIFITMNPGYAGRTELPDNLKSMFRPIAMVVPDSNMIAEIILFGEGFSNTKHLAKKVYTLYNLATQQLSKQDHYDFGLRALVSVLRYAGKKKRRPQNLTDEEILLVSLKDMNIAKLTSVDLPLFNGVMSDLFPGVEPPIMEDEKFKANAISVLEEMNLQVNPHVLLKVVQLGETKDSRHSTMIVGRTQSGKTVTWKVLQATRNRDSPGLQVKEYPLNPKALSLGELYGEFDLSSNEWSDGVLSSIMRQTCSDEKKDEKWIIFDGPVDTLWIESMNSVMDDNKVLTLINGERISMPDQVSLLFEVEDLAVASPATVSRCGMVYTDYEDLGWQPYTECWLNNKQSKELVEELRRLITKYVIKMLDFKRIYCKELVPTAELNGVISLCKLFDSLATPANGVDPAQDPENFPKMVELWFQFCMIWSICCSVDEDGRKKIDTYIREMEGTFPTKDTIYEYYVDFKNKCWVHWEEKLKKGWRYNPSVPFFKLMVPTVDTVRYNFLVSELIYSTVPIMLVGPVGTGKTSVAGNTLSSLDNKTFSVLTVYMSAQTSSNNIQAIIESRVEKRTKGVYVPIGGKKLITFLDDLNMPAKDQFGSQPPLELIRLWLDYGFWYDRARQTLKCIKGMLLMSAMGPPGGGRMVISKRLQSRFNLVNMTFPTDSEVMRIFGSMINQKLQDFEEEVKPIGDVVTRATVEMYTAVVNKFLPTPTKIHYLFNLRDISRIFQGMLRAHKDYHDTKLAITRLWIHECFRVFSDRLVGSKDKESFVGIITDKLGSLFDQTYHNICPSKTPPIFGDYMNPDLVYEDIHDMVALKKHMMEILFEYNHSLGIVPMDLVLFRDAVDHISKIVRVIRQPRGNMLLVGIGGSGRQSLTRLASYICDYAIFSIEVTKHYRKNEFREDVKKLYGTVGVAGTPTVFLFNDTQVAEESFMEDINNILSSGEVPNLYKPDELEEVRSALSDIAKKEGIEDTPQNIFAFLIERVRTNMHVVMCMSPVGEPFRNRIRMYPAFVNCTTIDWFSKWPQDALLEVADKYLVDMVTSNEEEEKLKHNIARMFSQMHKSVHDYSTRMTAELKRHNYVTPTNYLELVSGYKGLLSEKRKELGDAANKLKNGLSKIDETREKVQKMSIELDEDKIKVAQVQQQCDEFLSVLFQQKKEADDQQKYVAQKSERIGEEEIKCKHMADLAQQDLSEALPALEEAMLALEALNKKDIGEIKSYGRPPALVEKVMEAVMILKGCEPNWAEAKRQLGDPNFIKSLVNFDKDNISDRVLNKIGKYVAQADFTPDIIGRVSGAAKSLCMWVRAMEMYGRIYRVVEPKKIKLNAALAQLKEKQDALAEAKAKLAEVEANMQALRNQYDQRISQKEELRLKAEKTELMLDRAHKLVSGLAGEKVRWEETVQSLEESMGYLIGDCLIGAAFLSYMGPFLSNYRDELVNNHWLKGLRQLGIPCDPNFNFCSLMVRPTMIRQWNIQGLPSDVFSTENGIIVTKGNRWPLMIDPQGQAIKWIKRMEGNNGLKIIDMQQPDFMRTLEHAIQYGLPVLLQNVQETLDPSLDPILFKAIVMIGNVSILKLGDKEVEYNPHFRFYITTKLSNPHYAPEISTKTTIVNFAVKEQGLVAQLLGIVVRKEKPELEEMKDNLVQSIAANKKKLEDCEDQILRLLNETKGSLLEDETLVNTLQTSKTTSQEVTEQLATSEQTEAKIDSAREGYSPCAERASILFFVLNDLGLIDPMYQFSLDSYIDLFMLSIEKSHRSTKLEERIQNLNEYHTYAMYRYACRGLFGKHKLLFSFQMCVKILEAASKINMDEYNFFLRGGVVIDRDNQMDNPCSSWLSEASWDNITELDKLTNYHGIITSFEQYPRDWNLWYTAAEPEHASLPSDWDNACNELQKMLILRSLRPDRVAFCATTFIINNLGSKFVEPPVLDMNQVLTESNRRTPLIFVLSPGVDPASYLIHLAETKGMGNKFHALSLGQGQAPIATRLLQSGIKEGNWVFLANCHLSLSWMPQLDKLIEQLQTDTMTHNEFRLWLSSSPHPDFPISILQVAIKMTTEPPKGLKANMKRLYGHMEKKKTEYCTKHEKYKKLLFALCYFHSVLLERRKFLTLGWNIPYEFNDSDFEVSENLLSIYLQDYDETPWDALKYLIAGINYGGHVTDDYDRRLLFTYINDYFCEGALTVPFFKLSSLPTYYIPKDGPLSVYAEYVSMLPNMDHPEAFGQHPNADITSQIQETRLLFDVLLSLQPQVSTGPGESKKEDKVLDLAHNIFQQIPENIDYESTKNILSVDMSPLGVVLLQEIQRYNSLLEQMRLSLVALGKGIRGQVVMTLELENIFHCIFDGRVPPSWEKAYPSMKPLSAWTRDLVQRIDQLAKWAQTAHAPIIFWMSGFTFPTGFLTAVLQTSARQNNISVDLLSWEFTVMTVADSNITGPPKDGVYVKGLYLQGAGWDMRSACLTEALPIQLVCPMPTIHFKPVENKKKNLKGIYTCPCYYYPNRAGTSDRASFIVPIDLRTGEASSDHWTKRGTALLMSLDI